MTVYRYVRRASTESPAPPVVAPVQVTLTNAALKAELDRTMAGLGYDFETASEPEATLPLAFPSQETRLASANHAAMTDTASLDDAVDDRPTAPRPPPLAESLGRDAPLDTPDLSLPSLDERRASPLLATPSLSGAPSLGVGAPAGVRPATPAAAHGVPRLAPDAAFLVTDAERDALPEVGARTRAKVVVGALVLAAAVHAIVVTSAFVPDDYLHLYASIAHAPARFLTELDLGETFPLVRIFYLVFERVFGAHPFPFFLVALVAHIVCVALAARLLLRVTSRPLLSWTLAVLWGAGAVQQGSLDSFAAFGNVLATIAGVLVLGEVVRAHPRRPSSDVSATAAPWSAPPETDPASDQERDTPWNAGSAVAKTPSTASLVRGAALLVVASLSAPSGVAISIATAVALALAVPAGPSRVRALRVAVPIAGVALAGYVTLRVVGPAPIGKFFPGIPLFFAYVACSAGDLLFGPLVAMARGGGRAGFVEEPGGAVGLSVVALLACLVFFGWVFWRGSDRVRRSVRALLAVPLCLYALAAFDGASLLSLRGAAAVAVRPEWHYPGTLALAFALAAAFTLVRFPEGTPRWAPSAAIGMVVALAVLPSGYVATRMDGGTKRTFSSGRTAVEAALHDAIALSGAAKDVYVRNTPFPLMPPDTELARFPGIGAYYALLHATTEVDGKNVRFVENDPAVLASVAAARPRVRDRFASAEDARRRNAAVFVTTLDVRSSMPRARSVPRSARRRGALDRRPTELHTLPFKH
jgi:hypothetical protein